MRKSIIALTVIAAAFSSVANADTLEGALTELSAISPNMSQSEINQKIDRFVARAPEGTNIAGVLADIGVHRTQETLTPAKPAATQDQLEKANRQRTRQQIVAGGESEVNAEIEAEKHAKEIANYGVKHNSAGNSGEYHSNGKDGKDGKDGQSITGKKGATGSNGNDGVNGSNGVDGRNGKDADMNQVNDNTANIAANRGAIISHSSAINHNSAAIERNSQRIDKNTKDIAENRKAIKRVGAMAQAASNLHYNRNENGYAVSVGEYSGSTAIAGGVQFNTSKTTAVTVQASYDGDSVGASVGFHGNW